MYVALFPSRQRYNFVLESTGRMQTKQILWQVEQQPPSEPSSDLQPSGQAEQQSLSQQKQSSRAHPADATFHVLVQLLLRFLRPSCRRGWKRCGDWQAAVGQRHCIRVCRSSDINMRHRSCFCVAVGALLSRTRPSTEQVTGPKKFGVAREYAEQSLRARGRRGARGDTRAAWH